MNGHVTASILLVTMSLELTQAPTCFCHMMVKNNNYCGDTGILAYVIIIKIHHIFVFNDGISHTESPLIVQFFESKEKQLKKESLSHVKTHTQVNRK